MQNRLLTVRELADYVGVNKFTVYRWVEHGKIPHRRVDRLIRFDLREVQQFMQRATTGLPVEPEQ